MITAKEAVEHGAAYIRDFYGNVDGLRVEEIELKSQDRVWEITMGFWQRNEKPQGMDANAIARLLNPDLQRVYKQLLVSVDNGDILSMKIRNLAST